MSNATAEVEDKIAKLVGERLGGSAMTEETSSPTSVEEGRFDFNEGFQTKIAALQLRDPQFAKRTVGNVKPEYFANDAEASLVALSVNFFEKYRRVPSDTATLVELVKGAVKDKLIRSELIPEVKAKIKELLSAKVDDRDFVIDKVGAFARHQAIERAMYDSVGLLEKGAFDKIQDSLEKAFQVGSGKDLSPYDYYDMVKSRSQHRLDIKSGKIRPNGISTGVNQLDNVLFQKGWGRSELSVILAGAKKGKTTAIWGFGLEASKMGYNVLGVTLEVGKDVIAARLDANVSDTSMDDLNDHIKHIEDSVEATASRAGKYIIVEQPSGSFTPNDFRALIEDYKSQGIVFDLVVVDYLDIMGPSKWMPNEIANSKSIWVDMRGIAQEEGFAMLSATQTNREGQKAAVAKDTDVADDFNKIRIADIVISVNSDDDERARGEARLYFAASRNQKGGFSMLIKQDLDKMKFLTDVMGVC